MSVLGGGGLGVMFPAACQGCQEVRHTQQSPYRLVVRTSRGGRDNPGSTPAGDIWMLRGCDFAMLKFLPAPAFGCPSALGSASPKNSKPGQRNKVLLFALGLKKHNENTLCLLPYAFESAVHVAADILCSIAFKDSIDTPMV